MAEEKDVKKAEKKNAWLSYSEEVKKDVFQLNDGYKKYISDCKTERECVTEAIRQAKEQGYVDLNEVIANNGKLKAGDKVYISDANRTLTIDRVVDSIHGSGYDIEAEIASNTPYRYTEWTDIKLV